MLLLGSSVTPVRTPKRVLLPTMLAVGASLIVPVVLPTAGKISTPEVFAVT